MHMELKTFLKIKTERQTTLEPEIYKKTNKNSVQVRYFPVKPLHTTVNKIRKNI